ncbi:conserved hypothetical protein [Verticillium alfalfae VaMs.102]|uniref:Serum paraoxonase/arylesterase n=1 Tax=Verticillium alfalfae (strain VaMs.102 / ATCC MYA-4576 / FGSC 10136) TaxID=526221 RepID=C9SEL7_VERA1|nr:conserved hypothetical protein [Verticillium alfalfae VaMs.102]EEY16610.1 conserved hypothetical protein [Verticillium alfalfae VaMs.102]
MLKAGIVVVALLATVFQVFLKDAVWMGLGIGKTIQPLSDFPYTCRRIEDPRLEACEDMWLSETTRQLFLACSDSDSRSKWIPNGGKYDPSGQSQRDAIVALDLDLPHLDASSVRVLKTEGYTGTAGDRLLNLVGFTGFESTEKGEDKITLFAVNNRPPLDLRTGKPNINPGQVGANSTIEVFETSAGAASLKHIRTYANDAIATPNRVAALAKDLFTLRTTTDRTRLESSTSWGSSSRQATSMFALQLAAAERSPPTQVSQRLALGRDGLLYVPSVGTGGIHVYRILEDHNIKHVQEIKTGYSIDNLSVDQHGDIFVAAFPVAFDMLKAFDDPRNSSPAAAVLRVSKGEKGYTVDKVLEDARGEVLPAATTALHDAKTGRLFLSSESLAKSTAYFRLLTSSGVISPFIAVCEPKR